MWRMILVPLGVVLVASCATTSRLHEGQTALLSSESAAASAGAQKGSGDGFRRLWRSPGLQHWRLLKWDQDHSSVAPGAPPLLLQSIREEIGRLNQRPASGDDLLLTCTVYLYRAGGWFSIQRRTTSWSLEISAARRSGSPMTKSSRTPISRAAWPTPRRSSWRARLPERSGRRSASEQELKLARPATVSPRGSSPPATLDAPLAKSWISDMPSCRT